MCTKPVGAVLLFLAVITSTLACGGEQTPTDNSTVVTSGEDAVVEKATQLPPAAPPVAPHSLQASFEELSVTIPAEVAVSVAAVGSPDVVSFGSLPPDVAWSTIKVPLAIAALRKGGAEAETAMTAAISQSDNAAAEQLWSLLGDPAVAKAAVEEVLRLGGDGNTVVQSERVRPEFTPFGQTVWSLEDQTRFAAQLPCLDMGEVDLVMTQMANSAQRWGIAADGVPAKGGWGPDVDGGYLVRQFGVMDTSAGRTAVSLAAEPADGSFDSGVAALDQIADWLEEHRAELPSGNCPTG
jgi:hypothetical protein